MISYSMFRDYSHTKKIENISGEEIFNRTTTNTLFYRMVMANATKEIMIYLFIKLWRSFSLLKYLDKPFLYLNVSEPLMSAKEKSISLYFLLILIFYLFFTIFFYFLLIFFIFFLINRKKKNQYHYIFY